MTSDSSTLLKNAGWRPEVVNTLALLGYELADHDPVTEEAEFVIVPPLFPIEHGFTLHRQQTATSILAAIFEASKLHHQTTVRDALTSLATAAGLKLS